MVFKELYAGYKEGRKQKKKKKAYIKKRLSIIDAQALEASLQERETQKVRLAKENIKLMAQRKERKLKEKYARGTFIERFMAPSAPARPQQAARRTSKKPVKRKSIEEELRGGIA